MITEHYWRYIAALGLSNEDTPSWKTNLTQAAEKILEFLENSSDAYVTEKDAIISNMIITCASTTDVQLVQLACLMLTLLVKRIKGKHSFVVSRVIHYLMLTIESSTGLECLRVKAFTDICKLACHINPGSYTAISRCCINQAKNNTTYNSCVIKDILASCIKFREGRKKLERTAIIYLCSVCRNEYNVCIHTITLIETLLSSRVKSSNRQHLIAAIKAILNKPIPSELIAKTTELTIKMIEMATRIVSTNFRETDIISKAVSHLEDISLSLDNARILARVMLHFLRFKRSFAPRVSRHIKAVLMWLKRGAPSSVESVTLFIDLISTALRLNLITAELAAKAIEENSSFVELYAEFLSRLRPSSTEFNDIVHSTTLLCDTIHRVYQHSGLSLDFDVTFKVLKSPVFLRIPQKSVNQFIEITTNNIKDEKFKLHVHHIAKSLGFSFKLKAC
jgi:hypothetical protein